MILIIEASPSKINKLQTEIMPNIKLKAGIVNMAAYIFDICDFVNNWS